MPRERRHPSSAPKRDVDLSRRRLLGALSLPWLLGACEERTPTRKEGFLLFGMPIQITLADASPEQAEAAVRAAQAQFEPFYRQIHPWQDSELTRLNQALPGGTPVPTSAQMRELIRLGQQLSRRSDGLFDPAVGRLVELWGFHNNHPDAPREPPPETAIDALLHPPPRMDDLSIEGETVLCRNPNVQLDFNAIAEGIAVERSLRALRELGLKDVIIDGGGDLGIAGRVGQRPWRIAIQDPFGPGALAGLDVEGPLAVFTSGSYRRRFTHAGQSYNHLIDPRTGHPSREPVSATVLHENAISADAAATALMVAGIEEAPSIARRMGASGFLLADSQGALYLSHSLRGRLHWPQGTPARKVHHVG